MDPSTRQSLLQICQMLQMFIVLEMLRPSEATPSKRYMYACVQVLQLVQKMSFMTRQQRSCWVYKRIEGYYENILSRSHTDRMFRQKMRVSRATFEWLCGVLHPVLVRRDTHLRLALEVPKKVAIALTRLASGSTLPVVAELYGVGVTTAYRCVVEFCQAVKIKREELHCGLIWPSMITCKKYAAGFEAKHGIPNVIGAVDGSHIPITAPIEHAPDYYNRKGFHSILLQIIVDSRCLIWDYDVGWAGSMHDWALFQRTSAYTKFTSGKMGNYCILGDAGYNARNWLLTPYLNVGPAFTPVQKHWNFIQSSTRMSVERAFGILKARFRILLKKMEMRLKHVPLVVSTCLVLHNLCIIHNDAFDEIWIREAQEELQECRDNAARDALRELGVASDGVANVSDSDLQEDVVILDYPLEDTARRDALARALYEVNKCSGIANMEED